MKERKANEKAGKKTEKNLGSRSVQNVGIYQRMHRVSYSALILTLKAARNSPTPWSRVHLKKLLLLQLIKKYPAFYGPR
jgi:hypothetical protein